MLDGSICFVCPVHQTPMEYKVRFWGSHVAFADRITERYAVSVLIQRRRYPYVLSRPERESAVWAVWTLNPLLCFERIAALPCIYPRERILKLHFVSTYHLITRLKISIMNRCTVRSKISQDDMTARPVEQWQSYPFVRSTLVRCRNWRVQTSIHKF